MILGALGVGQKIILLCGFPEVEVFWARLWGWAARCVLIHVTPCCWACRSMAWPSGGGGFVRNGKLAKGDRTEGKIFARRLELQKRAKKMGRDGTSGVEGPYCASPSFRVELIERLVGL